MKGMKGLLGFLATALVLIILVVLLVGVPFQPRPGWIVYNSAQSGARCGCDAPGNIECSYSTSVDPSTGDFYIIWLEEPLLTGLACTGASPNFIPKGTLATHNGNPVAWESRGSSGVNIHVPNPFGFNAGIQFVTGNIVFETGEPIEPPTEPPVQPPVVQPGPTGNIVGDFGGLISNILMEITNFFIRLFGGVPS